LQLQMQLVYRYCLVADVAATHMQSMARSFIQKNRLRAKLQALADAAKLEEERKVAAEADAKVGLCTS
jgi:hypothetical protein